MLPTGKTRRKLRPFFHYTFVSIVIFLLTCVLAGIIIFIHLTYAPLLSPLGKEVTKKQQQTIEQKITQELADKNITNARISISGDTITIALPNNLLVYMSTKKDLHEQIASLQLTIQNLTIEKKTPSKIDFRFDRPVISF